MIAGLGIALPGSATQDELWEGFFAEHFRRAPLAGRIFAAAGVRTRQAVANPLVEDVTRWSTAARMQRYAAEAPALGKDAVTRALTAAGLRAEEIGLFTVVSCTGYSTPGMDVLLARDLGMNVSTRRLFVGHMGCYAAFPGLGAAADFVVAQGRPAVVLCLELTSLHLQPPSEDLGQVVSHALFGDAATAMVLLPAGWTSTGGASAGENSAGGISTGRTSGGLRLVDVTARTDPATAGHMTWEITDLGFRMGLSADIPEVLATQAGPVVADLLARNGISRSDVDSWAVHPGGPRILDVVAAELELPSDGLAESRRILARHGNCSSATVLLVLDEILRTRPPAPGRFVVAMAFGPGLTLYTALLRGS